MSNTVSNKQVKNKTVLQFLGQEPIYSKEAECAVLGTILLTPSSIGEIEHILVPDDFYIEQHRKIYSAALELYREKVDIDLITMTDKLKNKGDQSIKLANLIGLQEEIHPAGNIKSHAEIIRSKAYLRELYLTAYNLIRDCSDPRNQLPQDILARTENRLQRISSCRGLQPLGLVNKNVFEFISEKPENFLLKDAPEMPTLVTIPDENGNDTAFIRKGIVGALIGAGGIGKTHWLAELALSVASGHKFLGHCSIIKRGYVCIIMGENSDDDIWRLMRKTFKAMFNLSGISPHDREVIESSQGNAIGCKVALLSVVGMNAAFINEDNRPSLFFEKILNDLKDKAPDDGWSLIILDPISRFLGSEAEKDNAAATQFVALMERITKECKGNPTVLFGHHMGKEAIRKEETDQADARGSSALTDGVRLQINLKGLKASDGKSPHQIKMKVVKSNHTAVLAEQSITRDNWGCLRIDAPIKPTTGTAQITTLHENDSQPDYTASANPKKDKGKDIQGRS